ncbi:MAG TPA: response regulator [Polyangia bacterium]
MKILLVDDDKTVLDMMSRMLEHRGHDVHTCDTPFGVSAQIVRDPPDVVVLDVMMPGLGGSALASLIAKLELPRAPKVLLWSAMDDTALADAAREAGGLPWISKAMRASEIAAAIERLGRADDEPPPSTA